MCLVHICHSHLFRHSLCRLSDGTLGKIINKVVWKGKHTRVSQNVLLSLRSLHSHTRNHIYKTTHLRNMLSNRLIPVTQRPLNAFRHVIGRREDQLATGTAAIGPPGRQRGKWVGLRVLPPPLDLSCLWRPSISSSSSSRLLPPPVKHTAVNVCFRRINNTNLCVVMYTQCVYLWACSLYVSIFVYVCSLCMFTSCVCVCVCVCVCIHRVYVCVYISCECVCVQTCARPCVVVPWPSVSPLSPSLCGACAHSLCLPPLCWNRVYLTHSMTRVRCMDWVQSYNWTSAF